MSPTLGKSRCLKAPDPPSSRLFSPNHPNSTEADNQLATPPVDILSTVASSEYCFSSNELRIHGSPLGIRKAAFAPCKTVKLSRHRQQNNTLVHILLTILVTPDDFGYLENPKLSPRVPRPINRKSFKIFFVVTNAWDKTKYLDSLPKLLWTRLWQVQPEHLERVDLSWNC